MFRQPVLLRKEQICDASEENAARNVKTSHTSVNFSTASFQNCIRMDPIVLSDTMSLTYTARRNNLNNQGFVITAFLFLYAVFLGDA
jgi:hypothetical protein